MVDFVMVVMTSRRPRLARTLKFSVVLGVDCIEALEFGPVDYLKQKHGTYGQPQETSSPVSTSSDIVFIPQKSKIERVPYNEDTVLELIVERSYNLPRTLPSTMEATNFLSDQIDHYMPRMKATSMRELLKATQTDES